MMLLQESELKITYLVVILQHFGILAGQYCVLAGLNNMSFDSLEFWDIGSDTPTLMNSQQHSNVTHLFWDPTGMSVKEYMSLYSLRG